MALLEMLVTTAGGAASATVGVLVGATVTRRGQDRQWLRDRQVQACTEVLAHYARFTMVLRRAHLDRTGWDYDWGGWSAALVTASLFAPPEVLRELERFGRAVQVYLDRVATDPREHPLDEEELDEAGRAPALAQVALVASIRRSLGRRHGDLSSWLGGTPLRQDS